jgi:crotonobetainyl-CoA:carnitine CoA-transferase CaiB-like acyl-CoA transferase
MTRQPPRMGEHSAQVLAEAGFSPAEVAALAEAGVIVAASDSGGSG